MLLIKGGRLIDPSQSIDGIHDLLIEDGVVSGIAQHIDPPEHAEVIDATGMIVSPGFIDVHCHLREPGFEDKETIATGTLAAARGGFTTVCAMPQYQPHNGHGVNTGVCAAQGTRRGSGARPAHRLA